MAADVVGKARCCDTTRAQHIIKHQKNENITKAHTHTQMRTHRALKLDVVSHKLDIASHGANVAAKPVPGEFAGAVADGAAAHRVGERGEAPRNVTQC